MEVPNEVTVRMIRGHWLKVETSKHDIAYTFDPPPDDPTHVIKGIEIALTALGYKPQLDKMYQDMDLTILRFKHDSGST